MKSKNTIKIDLHDNPIRIARFELNKTLKQFADICGVHWQALYLNECGVYDAILPVILRKLRMLGYSADKLNESYREFQKIRRQAFGDRVSNWSITLLGNAATDISPTLHFRESLGLSRQGLAKALCVQPAILYKLDTGSARNLPLQLLGALKEAECTQDFLDEYSERTEEYYLSLRRRNGYRKN